MTNDPESESESESDVREKTRSCGCGGGKMRQLKMMISRLNPNATPVVTAFAPCFAAH
jgi:hypothetical protein